MFKIPNPPSPRAAYHEIADFIELLCIRNGATSAREVVACLGRLSENDRNRGCDDDSDEAADSLDEAMMEVERRSRACRGGYPFSLELGGTVLRRTPDRNHNYLYYYLLLSTRLNMQNNRMHAELDGTKLLETIAARALRSYLGAGDRVKAMVFGTAEDGTFSEKITDLCRQLKEGGGFEPVDEGRVVAQDDKLDAVAWLPFADNQGSQLIVFAQCKTGSNWRQEITQLQPDVFIGRWMRDQPLVEPVRAFVVSESCDPRTWKGMALGAGLVFDRCRLVDCCQELDDATSSDLKRWCSAALKSLSFLDDPRDARVATRSVTRRAAARERRTPEAPRRRSA